MTCCFTSFTYSYLARARILVESLRLAHPAWHLVAMIVDELPPGGDDGILETTFDEVLRIRDLGVPDPLGWIFKHDVVEACTAVKGHALLALLGEHEKVVYLDPDIVVFHPLRDLDSLLDDHSVILTPHQLAPNEAASVVAEHEGISLRYGVYNLGFLAVRADERGYAFARWWSQQLYRACYDEIENGVFTDQKYCDAVPALFDGVLVHRDPGWNVASWNISRRRLSIDDEGTVRSQGRPLCFYHFTKIGSEGDAMTSRYAVGNDVVLEVWEWYRRELQRQRLPWVPSGYWAFGRFRDGTSIPKAVRVFFRRRADLMAAFADPFAETGSLLSWVRAHRPDLLADAVTR